MTPMRSRSPKAWRAGLGDYFAGISAEQRQRMLRTEYGGMNEVLVNLAA